MTRKHNERFRGKTEVTIYGRRSVLEALAEPSVEVLRVMAAREAPAAFHKELSAASRRRGVEVEAGTARGVSEISGDARQDQGVVARIRLGSVMDVEALLARYAAAGLPGPAGSAGPPATALIALDNVTNPQNVGMIVRSVVGSGMDGMLWPLAGSPWISGLIIKSSAACVYRCRIVTCPTLVDGLMSLKQAGFRIYGLVAGSPRSLFDCEPRERSIYIVGSETEGLSREARALVDEELSIPMAGGVDSLNVAVAASLVCFQAAGARGGRRSRGPR